MNERPVEWREGLMVHHIYPDHAGRVLDAKDRLRAERLLAQEVYVVRPEPKLLRRQA